MAKFEKLRVSLASEDPTPIEEALGYAGPRRSRTEFLSAAFASPIRFLGRGKLVYQFHPLEAPEGFAAGFFSRSSPVELNHADLTPYVAENHEPALFLLSLDKGQVIWMEDNPRVGSPKRILESLFEHLLKKTDLREWQAFVRYFENQDDYWDVVREYRKEITKITFRYVPPNAFEGKKLSQKYRTAIQEQSGAEVVEEIFRAPPGKMDPEAEMMRANAEIAEQGAGERELRGIKNRLLYASGRGRVTRDVPDDEMPTVQSPSFVRRIISSLFE